MATLTLLPGLMCDARIFSPQCARFGEAVALDGFGCRNSIRAMAQHVIEVGPERMALLGHSMGARVALEVYRRAPERVDRLALVSTGVHPRREGEAEKRYALRDIGRNEGVLALVDLWLPPMVAASRVSDADLMTPLRKMAVDQGVEVFAAQIEALLDRPEVESLLPQIACPVLVAVGEEDRWSPPAQHKAIVASTPGARLRIIEQAGHMLPVEAPVALNTAIAEWLSN